MECFFADPKIYIFPRVKNQLMKENSETKTLEFVNLLDSFADSKIECPIQKQKFKSIETRIYADLAQEVDENNVKISRYFSIGFLKKLNDEYCYFPEIHKHNHALEVKAECLDSNIRCSLFWLSDRNNYITNDDDNSIPIQILPTGYNGKTSIQNIILNIQFAKNVEINNQEIIIKAKKKDTSKWKEEFKFILYKNQQTDIKAFNYGNKKIDDFFVIPTQLSVPDNQKQIIIELQKLNNQVLARNKKMQDEFCFLPENGQLDNEKKLIKNIHNSITAFKGSKENTTTGCQNGTIIKGILNNGIINNYPYNFDNFGQDTDLIQYLLETYKIDEELLKGIIIDKNYLYGNYIKGNPQNQIEGVKNLYDYVVVPFINNTIQHAESYLNFNRRWLSCPKYNNLYQRGCYTIPQGKQKTLYKEDGTTENLPAGTKIYFKIGADKYAFDKNNQSHKYKIVKINSTPKSGEVYMTLAEKKECDDRVAQNYCNYTETDDLVTKNEDKNALTTYRTSNGIPYYMNGMDSHNNKGERKLKSEEILNWNENQNNWYSYTKRPGTGDFGIDCSGFVSNSISSFQYNNGISHFQNTGNYFQTSVKATTIRDSLCRELPLTENTNGLSYLQKGDIVVSSTHIAFAHETSIDNYIPMDKINGDNAKYFTILQANGNSKVSNDGLQDTEESCVYLTSPSGKYMKGFFLKVIKGPFKHWGVDLEENSDQSLKARLGRVFLWY